MARTSKRDCRCRLLHWEAGIGVQQRSVMPDCPWHEPSNRHCSISHMVYRMRFCCQPAWSLPLRRIRHVLLKSAALWVWRMKAHPIRMQQRPWSKRLHASARKSVFRHWRSSASKKKTPFAQLDKMADDALEVAARRIRCVSRRRNRSSKFIKSFFKL